MDTYKIPTNVKQIGDVDDELRVYIEDYVYSYLLQYAKANDNDESIAMLIGRCMIIDNKKVLFISGAIQGIHAESKKGILTFSDETYDYIEEQRLKHFKGLEIVGWMLSQPGYGTYLSTGHINYHINNFKKPYQVMFVLDTIEKMNTFFQYDKESAEVKEMEGFFIFYEKNAEMQEYMAKNRIETKIEEESKEIKVRKPAFKPTEKEVEKEEVKKVVKENKLSIKRDKNLEPEKENKINVITIDKTKKIENKHTAKTLNPKYKQYVLAGGLALVVMGTVGMSSIVRDNKITKLENDVSVLTQAYNLLVTHVNNSDNVSEVFASNDVQVTENKNINDMEEEDKTKTDTELESESMDFGTLEEEVVVEVINEDDVKEESSVQTFTDIKPEYYIVNQGDSLISISRLIYGTDNMQQKIMEANNIEDPNKIYFGMKLLLP